jgi:hypothetical protein
MECEEPQFIDRTGLRDIVFLCMPSPLLCQYN